MMSNSQESSESRSPIRHALIVAVLILGGEVNRVLEVRRIMRAHKEEDAEV